MNTTEFHASLKLIRPRLIRFARLQMRNDAAAEDAVQEAMLAAVENISRFEGSAAVATWLFAILKNKIIDEFRRRARQPVTDDSISGLPERCARVFGMRELLGMETDDICKELNISTSNCWVLLHRARMGLRECLSQRWFGEKEIA